MTYTKTNWQDRIVQKPLTYQLQDNGDGTVTLIPVPGTITQEGTPINAGNLNNLETQYDLVKDYLGDNTSELWTQIKTAIPGTDILRFMMGSYVGDDTVGRLINLGVRPRVLWVTYTSPGMTDVFASFTMDNNNPTYLHAASGTNSDTTPTMGNTTSTPYYFAVINDSGFVVDGTGSASLNDAGKTYNYAVIY